MPNSTLAPYPEETRRMRAGKFLVRRGFAMQSPPIDLGRVQDLLEAFGEEHLAGLKYERNWALQLAHDAVNVSLPQPIPVKCPACDSPKPHLHPAMQFEGEVQPCSHPFHDTVTPMNTVARIAERKKALL